MLAYVIVTFTKKYKDQARTIGLDFLLILWMIVFTIPVLVLLALQSDLGTAMVFVAIFAGLVLLSGVSWKIIIPVFVTVVSAITGFLAIFITKDGRAFMHQLGMPTYQINRILAWLNPFDYAQTTTYQQDKTCKDRNKNHCRSKVTSPTAVSPPKFFVRFFTSRSAISLPPYLF